MVVFQLEPFLIFPIKTLNAMKKIIFIFLMISFYSFCHAQNLKEKFEELSTVKGMTTINTSEIPVLDFGPFDFKAEACAVNSNDNLTNEEIGQCYSILNTIPIQNMIIGAIEKDQFAIIYAMPSDKNQYDILFVGLDQGSVTVVLCSGSAETVNFIASSSVKMNKENLSVELPSGPNEKDNYLFNYRTN